MGFNIEELEGANGEVVVLSPELLGVKDDRYDDFVLGNVLHERLPTILARAPHTPYVREHLDGVRRCRRTCEFFTFCQGGQASNKYFETGRFTTTETTYCQNAEQELVRALGEDDCTFGADIKNTKMSGTDLRGSDLSNLSGPASLHGTKVTQMQLRQLSEVMIRDLDLTIEELSL